MSAKNQHGFTLIELVVVIVILGILAAFAVPRFMGMEAEARAATVKNMAGNLRAGSTMARSKCLAQGCGNAGFVVIDGVNVTMANGWPNAAGVGQTVQGANGAGGWTVTTVNGNRRFAKTGYLNCWVEYVPAASAAAGPTIQFRAGVPGVNGVNDLTVSRDLALQCQ
jgi:MSHA pilin protein MshA